MLACLRWLCPAAVLLMIGPAAGAEAPARPSTAVALESIFSPRRAPPAKTMGLLQRSFLDLVEVTQPALQVAVVVDGTESMGESLAGIREATGRLVADLQRYKGSQVSFQLVIYRDVGAASGEVSFPLKTSGLAFTSDPQLLQAAVEQLQPETGAPYFPELIDVGIHEALTRLPWSEDPQTSRWLLVFADAPPYDPEFDEPDTGARRRFATDQLIRVAIRQGVKINCVLCPSREEDQPAYQKMLDRTQQFLNQLATDTGGLMLDLSYSDIRQALEQAATAQQVSYREVGRITKADIEAARARLAQHQTLDRDRRLRLAVLPHMPLEQMVFDPDRPEVQLATELRHKLRLLPGVEAKSPVAVERQLQALRTRGLQGLPLLQTLATVLDVDYVVWGEMDQQQDSVSVRAAIYDRVAGRQVVQRSLRSGPDTPLTQIGGRLASSLVREAAGSGTDRQLAEAFGRLPVDPQFQAVLISPVSNSAPARSDLLAGFEALEQALAYPAGDPAAGELLGRAEASLTRASGSQGDPANPLAQLALASCLFNQAQALLNAGRSEEAASKSQACLRAINAAYRLRNNTQQAFVRTEIEADYNLLVKKDYPAAIVLYEQLAAGDLQTPLHSALRATWMLAGIYSGDWGVPAEMVSQAKAREQLIAILAVWPDSREAEFIRRNLRWDETRGENLFAHFPHEQRAVVEQMTAAEH